MIIYEIAALWFVGWLVTWPALLAHVQTAYGDGDSAWQRENYRMDLGYSMFFAMIPPTWVVAPFLTGFYQHGFQIMPKKETGP